MASIKVAVRCRPFTIDNKLGVQMQQNSDEEGEINLLNSSYSTNRFAFSYSWWSAYGYKNHCRSDLEVAEAMKLTNQADVYQGCGAKVMADLMDGNAVVLFAYGLSGSGKTFTVFGPDAPDAPEAWFKHAKPHDMWGLFPRLAYDLFKQKTDGWKITMKYFQNVVDVVRDLMSPTAAEQSYKTGMRKDPDGFMDIEWCSSTVLHTWDDLREEFMKANARKAIAPTQFNHQSTRGHCIMTLEIEMPDPKDPSKKLRGRIYICDLAGTEPAGDIYYANYNVVKMPDGSVEHKLIGPHQNQSKTKELQDQGKKINLSLSEMAQFFMKMADAVKKKKLKPGKSLPGCNSYFLCKYLKDTMLQAKTYLFCAIRPEVEYHKYTFATLGFAKNASVIKLQPKKATTAMSPNERKLMAELDSMKAMMEEMKKSKSAASGDSAKVAELQALLAAKQENLDQGEGSGPSANDEEMQRQKEQYGRRGISLVHFDAATEEPYFINVDEDPFRAQRFMYILAQPSNAFGKGGDIRPTSLSVVPGHCVVERAEDALTLVGGKGETYHNGKPVEDGQKVTLAPLDRVVIGTEMMVLRWKAHGGDGDDATMMDAEDVVEEFRAGRAATSASAAGETTEMKAMMDKMAELETKNAEMRQAALAGGEKAEGGAAAQEAAGAGEDTMVDEHEVLEMLKMTKDVGHVCDLLDRSMLHFEVTLERDENSSAAQLKVQVMNTRTHESVYIDTFDFQKAYGILEDERVQLTMALDEGRAHEVPEAHDPIGLMYDATFHLGTVRVFGEYLLYNLPTDDGDHVQDIKRAVQPYNNVGKLEVVWTPMENEEDENCGGEIVFIDDPDTELIGNPWTYRMQILAATNLPIACDRAYCQYEWFVAGQNGQPPTTEVITTDVCEDQTHSPGIQFTTVHHTDAVTPEFLDFLRKPLKIMLFVSPFVQRTLPTISTDNMRVREALGYATGEEGAETTEELRQRVRVLEDEKRQLSAAVTALTVELESAYNKIGVPKPHKSIDAARAYAASMTPSVSGAAASGAQYA